MDLNPAAVEAAAFTLANVAVLPTWMQIPALGRDMTPIAEIAVAAAMPLIVRATADAIADQILTLRPSDHLSDAARVGYDLAVRHAAGDARSFGSTAPEGQKP